MSQIIDDPVYCPGCAHNHARGCVRDHKDRFCCQECGTAMPEEGWPSSAPDLSAYCGQGTDSIGSFMSYNTAGATRGGGYSESFASRSSRSNPRGE